MNGTWATGEMLCLACEYDGGVHTWHTDSEPVECPKCHEFQCVPKRAEDLWAVLSEFEV